MQVCLIRKRTARFTTASARRPLVVAATLLSACTDPGDGDLQVTGIVRRGGVGVPGIAVSLMDTRTQYLPLVNLGSSTTDAGGAYTIQAPSARDGYACVATALFLSVNEFNAAPSSAPLRCTSSVQRIDLTVTD